MKNDTAISTALLLLGGLTLTSCSAIDVNVADGGFIDGSYTGKSEADDEGGIGEVELTIVGNDVTAASFVIKDADGTIRGSEYGKTNGEIINEEVYRKAQNGIAAGPKYALTLVETDDLAAVDSITGASLTHRQFVEAVNDAFSNARSQ